MKTIFASLILSLGLLTASADETSLVSTNDAGKSTPFSVEITLGGSGLNIDGESSFGMDFSVSTNPFEQLPNLWTGVAQGLYWEPTFAGSTDIFVDWSTHLFYELYVNTGWSVGGVYNETSVNWRTGPEVTFQYYIGDNAFIYAGANYDLWLDNNDENGFRYGFGVGLTF